MKYDSGMKQFHNDIIAALRYMLKDDSEITEKFGPGDGSPAPLRDYLKNRYGKLCASHIGDGMRYSCNAAKGLELTYDIILNNPGDKNLTLSWSQAAKFIRDNWDEVFKKSAPKPRPLETLVKTFDETEITCPHWERGKTLTYLEKVNGIHFECKAFLTEFCKFDDITKFFVQHCNCPEKCPYNKDAAEKQPSYIDKLRERYPKISETDDWFDGYYCPSELFDGDGVNDIDDEKCDYTTKGSEACPKCWRERCPANVEFLTDSYFEKEYFENYPEEGVPENTLEEKAAMKTGSEWELTHLCNKFGEDPCEYFMQTDNEKTVLNGKTLDICSYYCTSENKVRKIGSGGTWTGLSPKFCPKRRAAENKSICDDCINNDENCIKPSEDKCVGYTSESDTILNPAPESKPTYKDIFLEHYPNFDVSRFDEFINSNCRYACAAEYFTNTEQFDCNNPQSCKKCWYSPCESNWNSPDFVLENIEDISDYLKTVTVPENESPEEIADKAAVSIQDKNTEIQTAFDYSELDGDTAKNLRDCETVIRQETAGYFTLLGAKFKEARDLLANHANGTFEKWYTAMGFKRQTVYNLIQRYDFLGSPTIGGREDTFEALPLTLSYEVSKPDAPAELVEKVLDGDITTNAEYIKLKAELDRTREECRQIDKNSAAKDKEYERELKEANNRAEKEKNARENIDQAMKHVMADCQKVKDKNAELEKQVKELESRPVDVAVQDNDNAELMEELEELREENARLKDDSVKSMVIRLTLDEYDKLLEKLGGDPCLGHIIKHAKIIKL